MKIQRDVCGRLLYASLDNDIAIEKALSYPLAPISFCFCHADGNICKTPKSVVLEEFLEYQSLDMDVPDADIHIINGFYVLHTLTNVPVTYGGIANAILSYILYNRKEVHIIFDNYPTPSINDY